MINYFRIIILFLFPSILIAQETKPYYFDAFAEKIYLQFDNDVYTTNKTIWFKAIASNVVLHSPEFSSGILYVDLINSEKDIIESKLVKLKGGIGNGFFDLDRSYKDGTYLVRAYTEWNKNFGLDFIFKKYIKIYSENSTTINLEPIQNLRRIDSSLSTIRLKADVFPEYVDKRHQNQKLKIVISQDGVKDSISLKRNLQGAFDFDYLVKESTKQLDVEFTTYNKKHYATSFCPNDSLIDLQFFPESGDLVHGLPSKVGFKAIGTDGKGKYVTGVIVDNNDRIVSSFESNVLGMGHFVLKDVDSTLLYRAKFTEKSGVKETFVGLPKVLGKGITMSTSWRHDMLHVVVSSNDSNSQNIALKASCRGYNYFQEEANLTDGSFVFKIPKQLFPEGIISLKLNDAQHIPIAERMIFNYMPDNRINIEAVINKREYLQRDKVRLSIETLNSKKQPLTANLSSLVVDQKLFSDVQNLKETILSYFLLSSDLKGSIETPGAYFCNENSLNIDDLLLTQGWTNYKYDKIRGSFKYEMEQKLKVSGVINPKNYNKEKEELELMLMTFDQIKIPYTSKVMVPGTFSFDLDDIYGTKKDILIQPMSGSKDEKKKYTIALDKKHQLPILFDDKSRLILKDSIVDKVVNKNRKQKTEEDDFYFTNYGRTLLDEVVIDGYKMTPEREEMFNKYGKPDIVIDGEDIVEKTTDWSYGLYSVLRNAFWDKITILREGRDLKAQIFVNEVTLVVIDGIPVLEEEYPFVQYLSPDEIVSVEIIKFPKNFNSLYRRVYPIAGPPYPDGSIISIYTKKDNGLYGALKSDNNRVNLKSISVFSIEKDFYTPKYENDDSFSPKTLDIRAPLYWNPEIITNDEGKAVVEYYNSDIEGEFLIIIEAITNSGQLGYKWINYTVKANNN